MAEDQAHTGEPPGHIATVTTVTPLSPPGYELLDEVGHGGMGVVYRARDVALDRDVAVKLLSERYPAGSPAAQRFLSEARITGQLQHPGIPAVHQVGTLANGRPFLAMKLIKGSTLEVILKQRSDPSAERGRLLAIFEAVCQAVGYAHAHRVLHRDLKPANVMVGAFGEVQVMDWGLAKVLGEATPATAEARAAETQAWTQVTPTPESGSHTQAGSLIGRPAFIPPEQAGGEIERVNERADVFGLGALWCVILTGKPPYVGETFESVRVQALRGKLEDCFARLDGCDAEPELVALCKRCLAFDPADRPRDAGAVADEVAGLRAAAEERARVAEKEQAAADVKEAEQKKRRRWQRAVAAAVGVILALVGGGAWWIDHQAAERDKERAVAAERDRQEATAALAHAEQALSAGDLAAADQALTLAESRLNAEGPAELAARLATAERDRDYLRGLREIEDLSWVPGLISSPEPADMAKRFQAVIARYGLDVSGADPARVAEAVHASRVSAALASGLSEWFCVDPKGPHLREVLDLLDPDSDRSAIRAAIQAGDEARLRNLVAALDGSKAPAWFAASIGYHSMMPKEDGVRLMAAAWRTHPSDYALAYRCSRRLWGTQKLEEMLAWAKVAVALRPDRPFAHAALTRAFTAKRDWPEAEASAHRAIELGRNYPKYPGPAVLAGVQIEKGDLDGAEANLRAALAIDPDAYGLLHNVALVYIKRDDILTAEAWLRKTVAAVPESGLNSNYYRQLLGQAVRIRERRDEVATGRAAPANPDEALQAIRQAMHPSRQHFAQAARLFTWAFAKAPALADDLAKRHRSTAARCAVLAAAGRDKESPKIEPAERNRLNGLALKWLRADLDQMTIQAKDPQRERRVEWLTRWKEDPDLAPVRDPASLAALPWADAEAWRSLWRDVNSLLASLGM